MRVVLNFENKMLLSKDLKKRRKGVSVTLLKAIQSEVDRHTADVKRLTKKPSSAETPNNSDSARSGLQTSSLHLPAAVNLPPEDQTSLLDFLIRNVTPTKSHKHPESPFDAPKVHDAYREESKNEKWPINARNRRRSLDEETNWNSDSVLRINPYKLNPNLDLLELREMREHGRKKKKRTPIFDNEADAIQYRVFNDKRLVVPTVNLRKAGLYYTDQKASVAAGGNRATHVKYSGPKFRFRNPNLLLKETRKNRKMDRETRLDITERIRETHRANVSMVIKRRMVDLLNSSISKFDSDIMQLEEETEVTAKEFDDYLHESDGKTIVAIKDAEEARTKRLNLEKMLRHTELQNNLLECHNIRKENKVKLVERCMDALCTVLHVDKEQFRSEHLKLINHQDASDSLPLDVHKEEAHVNIHKSLSEESEECYSGANDRNGELPLFRDVDLPGIIVHMTEYYDNAQKSVDMCAGAKKDIRDIKHGVSDKLASAQKIFSEKENICTNLQEKIKDLRALTEELKQTISASDERSNNRAIFRAPLDALRNAVTELYTKYIRQLNGQNPQESKILLGAVGQKLDHYKLDFQHIPECIRNKWFAKVNQDRIAEERFCHSLRIKEGDNQKASMIISKHNLFSGRAFGDAVRPRRVPRSRSQPPSVRKSKMAKQTLSLLDETIKKISTNSEERDKWLKEDVSETGDSPPSVATEPDQNKLNEGEFTQPSELAQDVMVTAPATAEDPSFLSAEVPANQENESVSGMIQEISTTDADDIETEVAVDEEEQFITMLASRYSVSDRDAGDTADGDHGVEANRVSLMDDFFGAMDNAADPEQAKFGQFRKSRASAEARRRSSKLYQLGGVNDLAVTKVDSLLAMTLELEQTTDDSKKE